MADQKISELTNITGANLADADEFVVVDVSADQTKAVTLGELKEAFDTGTGFVRITGDTMTGDLSFGDNDKAIFGSGSDLQVYHTGGGSYIDDTGAGNLLLKTNGNKIAFQNDNGGSPYDMFAVLTSGAIQLNHLSDLKLATTSTGIDVTGTVTADGLTVDGQGTFTTSDNNAQVTLISTDTDALVGPQLNLWRNSGTGTNGDLIGQITFTGEDTIGSTNTFASIYGVADQTNNGSEDGSIHFQTLINGVLADRLEINSEGNSVFTGTVSADGLTVDGGAGSALITTFKGGTSSQLIIQGDADNVGDSGELDAKLTFATDGGTAGWDIAASNGSGSSSLQFLQNNNKHLNIASNGDISFYDDQGSSQSFFWDASAESLGIGTSSPATALDVTGTVTADGLTVSNTTGSLLKLESTGTGLGAGSVIGDIQFYGNDASTPGAGIKAGIKVETVASLGDDAQMKFTTSNGTTNNVDRMLIANNGDISFYENTGTTPKFFWDASAESLGIGTDSPQKMLHLAGAAAPYIMFDLRDNSVAAGEYSGGLLFMNSDDSNPSGDRISASIKAVAVDGFGRQGLTFSTGHTNLKTVYGDASDYTDATIERMRIDDSGNVGIGTSSPTDKLNISSGSNQIGLDTGNQAAYGTLDIGHFTNGAFIGTQAGSNAASNLLRFGTSGSERMRIDSSGNVGIGTSSPVSSSNRTTLALQGAWGGQLDIMVGSTVHAQFGSDNFISGQSARIQSRDGIVFRTNGDNERMRLDSSGNLLVGTTSALSPNAGLGSTEVSVKSSISADLILDATAKTGGIKWSLGSGSSATAGSGFLSVYDGTSAAERMRIEANGDVGIGESDPDAQLHVNSGTANLTAVFESTDSTASLYLVDSVTTGGTSAVHGLVTTGNQLSMRGINTLAFRTGGTERMQIDASGNLLVGKANADTGSTAGLEYNASVDVLYATRAGTTAVFNRLTSDGDIMHFRRSGSTVGRIGALSGGVYIGDSDVGLQLDGAANAVRPCNTNTPALSDNFIDLGSASVRFDDIYATNGTIQTSDRNEKQDIETLSDAEQRVAVACKGLLRKFRWIDSVAEKGDDARIHFGIIAQDLQDAFAAEGLDAGRYAMFISTTWWETQTEVPAVEAVSEVLDEDGNVVTEAVEAKNAYTRTDTYETIEDAPEGATERTRLGVRYPELLAFIIAAI